MKPLAIALLLAACNPADRTIRLTTDLPVEATGTLLPQGSKPNNDGEIPLYRGNDFTITADRDGVIWCRYAGVRWRAVGDNCALKDMPGGKR